MNRLMCMATSIVRSALAAGMLALSIVASAQGVGLERLLISEAGNQGFDAVIFYPARAPQATTSLGPYEVLGLLSAVPRAGRFPLILISHGSRGSMLSHHLLASHLALNGFIVAALTHESDNSRDYRGQREIIAAHTRAHQLSLLLTATLNSSHGARIDRERVGVIGYSAGSVTAMMLAGALPDLARLQSYGLGRPRMDACEAEDRVKDEIPQSLPIRDARIKGALLLAPIGVVFSKEALEAVQIPVGIVAAQADEEAPIRTNLRPFAKHLRELALLEVVPGAGHGVFLAPCSDRLSAALRELCKDGPLIDRRRIHAMMSELVISFFWYVFESRSNPMRQKAAPTVPPAVHPLQSKVDG